jgi:CBS domain-containing protein/uncharacterized protein (DUF2267 family)
MGLEQFSRSRLVVLGETASAYEAARAMEENHIGMVLVHGQATPLLGVVTDRDLALRVIGGEFLPHVTPLRDVLTEPVYSLPISADVQDAIQEMRTRRVRRMPIVDEGRVVGVVTLDDLLAAGAIDASAAAEIARAQLEQPARLKPAGETHPVPSQAVDPAASVERRVQHAEQTASLAADVVSAATGIIDRTRALTALEIMVAWLARRLTPSEAKDMLSQLPAELRDRLIDRRVGPDRHVTRAVIEGELERRLGIAAAEATLLVPKLGRALALLLTPGELVQVRGQLPEELRSVLPDPSLAHAGGEDIR